MVPRSLLAEYDPHPSRALSRASVQRLQAWLALRCCRPAWPDIFVKRIAPVADTLARTLEAIRDDVAEVRVAIAPNDVELGGRDNYRIAVYFVVDENIWLNSPELRTAIHEAFLKFVGILRDVPGVRVQEDVSQVVSGDRFSWQDCKLTDTWNFANLTHIE